LQTFTINAGANFRDCAWLQASSQEELNKYCQPGTEIYDICEETCGKCVDDCTDDINGVFLYTSSIVPQLRTCGWLLERPNIRRDLCVATHDAFKVCQETCNSCPSEFGKIEDVDAGNAFLKKIDERGVFESAFEEDQTSTEDLLWQRMRGEGEELVDDRETRSRQHRQNVFDREDATLELDTFLDNLGSVLTPPPTPSPK